MLNQVQKIDISNLPEVVGEDLYGVYKNTGSLQWEQTEHSPWWQELKYGSEEEARSQLKIDKEEYVRDHRVLVTETLHFDIRFIQGAFRRTSPQGFEESLQFVLKKESWKGRLSEGVPTAYMFFDKSDFTQEQIDYFSLPRFSLDRHVNWDSGNINLKSSGFGMNLNGEDRIHEIPKAEKLIRTLVRYSHNNDIIFTGTEIMGVDDKKIRAQMANFRNNLAAAYGIATAECGSGIIVTGYNYGV